MMKDSFRGWLPWFIMILFAFAINTGVKGEEDQSELLNVLRSGIDESMRDAQFKCAYSYSLYVVDSQEEAERFDTTNGKRVLHATGSLIKSKTMTYESFEKDQCDTKRDFYLSDHITVTNQDLSARYVKEGPDATHRTLFVLELKKTKSGLPLLDQVYAPIICPLTVSGSRSYPSFFDCYDVLFSLYPDSTTIDVSQGKETTEITIHFDIPNTEKSDDILTLSNEYPYPVVISRREKKYNSINGKNGCNIVQTFDLVDTGRSLFLPKKICCADGPIVFDDFGDDAIGKWLIRIWESDDLGKKRPKESDFFIHLVDEGTTFGGLALDLEAELYKNPPEYFDLNKFSFDDLQNRSELEATMPKQKSRKVFRSILILLGVIFIGAGLYFKWNSTREIVANEPQK